MWFPNPEHQRKRTPGQIDDHVIRTLTHNVTGHDWHFARKWRNAKQLQINTDRLFSNFMDVLLFFLSTGWRYQLIVFSPAPLFNMVWPGLRISRESKQVKKKGSHLTHPYQGSSDGSFAYMGTYPWQIISLWIFPTIYELEVNRTFYAQERSKSNFFSE